MERLVGLTEMVPDRVWGVSERGFWWSLWFARRTVWVLGISLALLALPPFVEQQRVEYEEMQNMQKKQVSGSNVLTQPFRFLCEPSLVLYSVFIQCSMDGYRSSLFLS